MAYTNTALRDRYRLFKAENPKLRIRDAAKQLGVSERDLIAIGEGTIALRPAFTDILCEIPSLGRVMALTRNDHAVHERKGTYTKASFVDHIGMISNPDIDLRIFINAWRFGFAVQEGEHRSLQFFGMDGEAIHKIHVTEQTDIAAYDTLVAKYRADIQHESLLTEPTGADSAIERREGELDVAGFQRGWLDRKDTHDPLGLIGDFSLSRRQAIRLAPQGHATSISVASLKRILEGVSERKLEIMVLIGNRGCIQVHTGPIRRLLQTGPWFNVLDPDFNMHLREDGIESLWLIQQPIQSDIVTSIEAFDHAGQVIAKFVGKHKPGIPQTEDWRQVITDYAIDI